MQSFSIFGLIQRCIACFPRSATSGLIARIDWTTVWNALSQGENGALRTCMLASPEDALRHDADAVLTYLVVGTGDADFVNKRDCPKCRNSARMRVLRHSADRRDARSWTSRPETQGIHSG